MCLKALLYYVFSSSPHIRVMFSVNPVDLYDFKCSQPSFLSALPLHLYIIPPAGQIEQWGYYTDEPLGTTEEGASSELPSELGRACRKLWANGLLAWCSLHGCAPAPISPQQPAASAPVSDRTPAPLPASGATGRCYLMVSESDISREYGSHPVAAKFDIDILGQLL